MKSRVIKENDLFLMTEENGDLTGASGSVLGLYTKDTRFLSRLEIRVNGEPPVLLSSSAEQNYRSVIRMTNPHMEDANGRLVLWRESIEIERNRFIYDGVFYESVSLTNFFPKPVEFAFSIAFAADFADMFVVRGYAQPPGGRLDEPEALPGRLTLRYTGSDEVVRETRIEWDGEAQGEADGTVLVPVALQPKEKLAFAYRVIPVVDGEAPQAHDPAEALAGLEADCRNWNRRTTLAVSDHQAYNRLFDRGVQDLRVLMTDVGYGFFPVAGLPLFAVPFGRDSLIAALQMLSVNPDVARGTLRTMAAMQGTMTDEWRDEQPGKIMHEIRYGELANRKLIPFTPYYGTVDATPLFLVLAAEYYHWSGDAALMRELLEPIRLALEWIDRYGDFDNDGFVEYRGNTDGGLSNQGWKDSGDSIVHANGDYAQGSIALAEVQGYVYQAKTRLAPILGELGHADWAKRLLEEADALRERFEQAFWMEEEQYYAIALDGDKKQVRSVTSNPGHVLMSGLMPKDRSRRVADTLLDSAMFSGYGIRTMGQSSAGYNPMSYHDGSVWPHDNSLIALGLMSAGYPDEALAVMDGLTGAAAYFEYDRLPELFCGYDESIGHPVSYPVACSPQAWAAGTPLLFLQIMLGLKPDAVARTIGLAPTLLTGMNELVVERLRIGAGYLSLKVSRGHGAAAPKLEVTANTTGFELLLPPS